ncbi:hypothetical protein QN239_00720 [Mycolicibacterium sp. Y3]
MNTTTDVVQLSRWKTYRRHGYYFREAAMLTILIGFGMHLCRVLFGDEAALRYVVTPVGDLLLLVPMAYAAVTGIVGYRRMAFVNRPHRIALTAAIGYIAVSVPLHLYVLFVLGDVSFYVHLAGYWFSYLLLCLVYPVFLVMLARVRYRD